MNEKSQKQLEQLAAYYAYKEKKKWCDRLRLPKPESMIRIWPKSKMQ